MRASRGSNDEESEEKGAGGGMACVHSIKHQLKAFSRALAMSEKKEGKVGG